jgi:serine/threonine-protein kinase RsbW
VVDDTPGAGDGAQVIEVRTAAIPAAIPTLRTVAADVAMRQDFDLDAIEDLRMAVDEACSLLLGSAADGNLRCVFTTSPNRIQVSVSVLTESPELADGNALGWQLLSALTTSVERTVTPAENGYLAQVELVREGETASR